MSYRSWMYRKPGEKNQIFRRTYERGKGVSRYAALILTKLKSKKMGNWPSPLAKEFCEILERREKAKQHIWSLRTPEEATSNWKEFFGHLDDEVPFCGTFFSLF